MYIRMYKCITGLGDNHSEIHNTSIYWIQSYASEISNENLLIIEIVLMRISTPYL